MDLANTDIIVVNGIDSDFPLFRSFLHQIHSHVNNIYYVFSNGQIPGSYNEECDLEEFIRNDMPFVTFINATYPVDGEGNYIEFDWRDECVNQALNVSTAENVLFMEPDMDISADAVLWLRDNKAPDQYDVYTFYTVSAPNEPSSIRIWPSFMWVRRSLVEQTSKCFARKEFDPPITLTTLNITDEDFELIVDRAFRNPPIQVSVNVCDHFDQFAGELLGLTDKFYFFNEVPSVIPYEHLEGGTQNFSLACMGMYDNMNYPSEWVEFFERAISSGVAVDPRVQTLVTNVRAYITAQQEAQMRSDY